MRKLVRTDSPRELKVVFEKENPTNPTLNAKLLEEVAELLLAGDRDQRLKELGDIQEVLWAVGDLNGITAMEITSQAISKRNALGTFDTVMRTELQPTTPTLSTYPIRSDGPWYSG